MWASSSPAGWRRTRRVCRPARLPPSMSCVCVCACACAKEDRRAPLQGLFQSTTFPVILHSITSFPRPPLRPPVTRSPALPLILPLTSLQAGIERRRLCLRLLQPDPLCRSQSPPAAPRPRPGGSAAAVSRHSSRWADGRWTVASSSARAPQRTGRACRWCRPGLPGRAG